jgi:hypothetical protein
MEGYVIFMYFEIFEAGAWNFPGVNGRFLPKSQEYGFFA